MPIDREVLDRIFPEPMTPEEQKNMESISIEDFSIYSTKLELICDEAKQVLVNLSSSIIGQAGDCVVGIYTAAGDLALAGAGTFLHVATGVVPAKYVVKHFTKDPTVGIEDGDSFICNEALYGGIHNPDIINFAPIFWNGKLIAWAAAAAHIIETGASEPGGQVPYARSRYEEGLKMTPLKVGAKFELKNDVLDMLCNMVRTPASFEMDVRARMAACNRVREKLLEVVQEKGEAFVVGLLHRVLKVVEEASRQRIRQLCDGTTRFPVFFDTAGNQQGLRVSHVSVCKRKDTITIDLSGTSPATQSYVNSKPHQIRAVLLGDLLLFFFADLPVSSALLSCIRIKAPSGTLVNCPDDSAIAGVLRVASNITIGIHHCLSKLFYVSGLLEAVTTPKPCWPGACAGGGKDEEGMPYSWGSSTLNNANGNSATPQWDGIDASQFCFSSVSDCLDVEHYETQIPLLILFRRLLRDHAGFGKFRGGTALSGGFILQGTQPLRLLWACATGSFPMNAGMMGGFSSPIMPLVEMRGVDWDSLAKNEKSRIPHSLEDALPLISRASALPDQEPFMPGDGFVVASGSSGGWGDPLERDPQLVLDDIKKGITSLLVANTVYGVALDSKTGEIDSEVTKRLRAEIKKQREAESLPYTEFECGWLKQKPAQEHLRYYGPWPSG
ncbi:MAG: hydantoinase B/oxoprolinase family protein, partial [bacterium]